MKSYHEHPAISASKLKKMACGTELDYWATYVDPERMPFQPTDAMRQGSLVDCLITEPQNFDRKYVVAPKCDRRTKAGKAEWAEAQELARSKCAELIAEDWHHTAQQIASKLLNDPVSRFYLLGSGQKPHFWQDEKHDTECRYLPDTERPDYGLLVDLKKSRSANPAHFARQSYSLGYDIQCAHYAEGYRDRYSEYPKTIALLAYEWAYPFNFSINIISEELLEVGRSRRDEAMAKIKDCSGINEWSSWGVNVMEPPAWLRLDDPANSSDVSDLDLEGLE
ncbi:MAG: PD-(D/E)XK nuclease-like domain-containing protein [Gammaproteobacteria bacterium]